MAAVAEASSCGDAIIRLNCSHGGRFVPCGPEGALRYVGGEMRVLAVPRAATTFRDLAARLSREVAGGAEVRAIRHRLADEGLEDVIVSVTCDAELAHMRDEYDRLRATRPAARFRVFVITSAPAPAGSDGGFQGRSAAAGLPPLAPKMRRVQSELAQLHRRPALPAPMRRIQSALEFAPSFHHRRQQQQQCCCNCHCQRRDLCVPTPPPARTANALPFMSKKVAATSAPVMRATGRVVFNDAAREKARSRAAQAAMENGRTIWESVLLRQKLEKLHPFPFDIPMPPHEGTWGRQKGDPITIN